jgi:hypothetical protein
VEALHLPLLPVVGLHQRRVREALLGHGADRATATPLLARCLLDEPGEAPCGHPEERGHEQRRERELPLEDEERACEEDEPERIGDPVGDAGEHQRLDGRDVAGDPGDHIAESAAVEEVERQPLDVREEVGAQ